MATVQVEYKDNKHIGDKKTKKLMDEEFLLDNEISSKLYHTYAEKLPIIDYHCHVSPKEIYENRRFNSLQEI